MRLSEDWEEIHSPQCKYPFEVLVFEYHRKKPMREHFSTKEKAEQYIEKVTQKVTTARTVLLGESCFTVGMRRIPK